MNIRSPSFPSGLSNLRSEESVRAAATRLEEKPISMLDVIRKAVGVTALPCPFCGTDPGLARQIHGRYHVCCEGDDCGSVEFSGATLSEVWAKWNRRHG